MFLRHCRAGGNGKQDCGFRHPFGIYIIEKILKGNYVGNADQGVDPGHPHASGHHGLEEL